MKKLFLLLTLGISVKATAQSSEYILDGTKNGVQYYHKIVNCNGQSAVLLRFINTNKSPVKIAWEQRFVTQLWTESKPGLVNQKELILPPGESSASGCDDRRNSSYVVLSGEVSAAYPADIRGFEFHELVVTLN